MEIKLDGEAVAEIASAAIFQSMSTDARENILKQAVQALLTPDKDSRYSPGYGKTPLQQAFESAIQQAAFKAVREFVETNEEIKAEIDKLLGPLILGVVKDQADRYDDSLAEAIGKAIGNWLADKARDS